MNVQYRYEPFQLKDIIGEKTIRIPQFQRNVVWNQKKRKEFVETLCNGNPFGSILVHQNEKKEYYLIDGLQRVSTIKNYYKNPFEYFDYKILSEELTKDLIKHNYEMKGYQYDKDSEAVKQCCIDIQKTIFRRLANDENTTHIIFETLNEYSLINDEKSFSILTNIMEDAKKNMDINDLLVPAIVYTGPSENLPTIFYNLNTGGVNLSKYETFSSLWDSSLYRIEDEDINNKIFEKYEQMRLKSDLEVDITKEDIINKGVTLFEYCYSISEILRGKKFNLIFGTNKKSTDPIGFEILSLMVGLDVNKAEKLGLKESSDKKGFLVGASPKFLVDLKNCIVETFQNLIEALEYWIIAKNGANNTLDSTYMIYHMAMSYIRHNYEINLKNFTINKITDKKWNEKFVKYLPLHYFRDYITDFWKINRQVSDLSREVANKESLEKYVKNISPNEWQTAFTQLRENQLNEVGATVSLKAKLFIDYLVKYKIDLNPALKKYFEKDEHNNFSIDFEHIIPQNRIEKQLELSHLKGYPISSLGNICYLASTDNRAKREKTLYEYIQNRPSFILDKEYITLINYPTQEELSFIDYAPNEFDKEYKNFLGARLDSLFSEFIEVVRKKYR